MNGKFRTILFGFKRKDVIEYVKELSAEKGRLAEENLRLEQELERAEDELSSLSAMLASSTRKLEDAERSLAETRESLVVSESGLELAAGESSLLKEQLRRLVDSVSAGCSVSDAELRDAAEALSGISARLTECLSPVKESLSGASSALSGMEVSE